MNSVEIARKFVEKEFPHCKAAILAGSACRGEETDKSDLDIVVVVERAKTTYEESLQAFGRSIDVLFNSHETCRQFFKKEMLVRRPVLTHMCAQGIIIKDEDGLAQQIQQEARMVIAYGPEPVSDDDMDKYRHQLTNLLDDFISSRNPYESYIIAQHVLGESIDIQLRANRQWLGAGKWLLRACQDYDPILAQKCCAALDSYYKHGSKEELIMLAEEALNTVGGRNHKVIRGIKEDSQQDKILASDPL